MSCRNLKYSTTLEYLNQEVTIMNAISLIQFFGYMTKIGVKMRMSVVMKGYLSMKSSTRYHISNAVMSTAQRIFNMRITSSQHFNSIYYLLQSTLIQLIHCKNDLSLQMVILLIFYMQSKNYQFHLQDQNWTNYLKDNGFVVIKNIIKEDEVLHAKNLFWEWLEALGSGIKRDDPSTWNDQNWPGSGSIGFFVSYGGCHSKASWYLRTHPNVRQAFAKIWETPSLITSFDTFICWRPWWNAHSKSTWDPFVQNLHMDQNPHYKRGFHCVQGMIPLIEVSADNVGGLQVVPQTNNDATQDEIIKRYPWVKNGKSDWVELKFNDPFRGKAMLVECKAGDLIFFDSRTIHGGKIIQPKAQFKEKYENQLVRLAMTVTMVPKQLESIQIRTRRIDAFKKRVGLTHWPHEYQRASFGSYATNIQLEKMTYQWPELTPQIQDLI